MERNLNHRLRSLLHLQTDRTSVLTVFSSKLIKELISFDSHCWHYGSLPENSIKFQFPRERQHFSSLLFISHSTDRTQALSFVGAWETGHDLVPSAIREPKQKCLGRGGCCSSTLKGVFRANLVWKRVNTLLTKSGVRCRVFARNCGR